MAARVIGMYKLSREKDLTLRVLQPLIRSTMSATLARAYVDVALSIREPKRRFSSLVDL